MTTIILVTNDQSLSVLLKPLVASGDYNLVRVKVEFDSAWERYPVRSAVFRTLKGAEAEVLLADDECIIPHEVLAEAGTLFIAMRGVTLDGKIIKTTEEVKYKIVQGAKDIASTTAPSHDMFAQYMAAIAEGLAPHVQDMNTKADAKLAEIEADADAAVAKYEALAGSYIRMKTGSYVGTGTHGSGNKNTLTFDFEPIYVIVYKGSHNVGYAGSNFSIVHYGYGRQEFLHGGGSFMVYSNSETYGTTRYTMAEKTLSWYNDHTKNEGTAALFQMNQDGTTYYYIAFGV